jgi:hypothetical protein
VPAEDFNRERGKPNGAGRERPDGARRGFPVQFEQPFRHGPGGQREGVAFREVRLPFPPVAGLVIVFENDLFPRIEDVYWHMATETFWCRLERDTAVFGTPEEALAYYGEGWRLDQPD